MLDFHRDRWTKRMRCIASPLENECDVIPLARHLINSDESENEMKEFFFLFHIVSFDLPTTTECQQKMMGGEWTTDSTQNNNPRLSISASQ